MRTSIREKYINQPRRLKKPAPDLLLPYNVYNLSKRQVLFD